MVRSAAPTAQTPPARSLDLFAAAQSLTGIAALVLGLTYAIGASLRAGELREAGVDVRDGLAVVPIEQLLTRGIDALLDPRNVALFVALAVLGVVAAASGWATKRRIEGYQHRFEADQKEFSVQMAADQRARSVAMEPDPELRRLHEERLKDEVNEELQWREQQLAELTKYAEEAPERTQAAFAALAGLILVIVVLGFVPWIYAVSVVVGVLLLALLAIMMWRTGTPPRAAAFFVGLLLVVASGIIIDGQLAPSPPAPVKLDLADEAPRLAEAFATGSSRQVISGRLVAVTPEAWYLTSGKPEDAQDMLSVDRDDVVAGVTSRVDRDVNSVVEIIWTSVF